MIFHSSSNFASRNDEALLQKGAVFIITEAGCGGVLPEADLRLAETLAPTGRAGLSAS